MCCGGGYILNSGQSMPRLKIFFCYMVQLRAFVEDNHRSEVKEVAILTVDPMQVKNQMKKCKMQQLYPNYKENAGR